jgi:hypothetical protein
LGRDLFNGIVTLDKVVKHLKRAGNGYFDFLSAIINHSDQLLQMKIFDLDEVVR